MKHHQCKNNVVALQRQRGRNASIFGNDNIIISSIIIMKKFVTIIAAAAMMFSAGTAFAQINVGAGYVNSVDKTKVDDKTSTNTMNGFYVGGGYSIPIVAGLKVTPGVYYNFLTKSDAASVGSIATLTGDLQEHYLNVPVSFSYGYEFTPDFKVFAYAGPTFSVGLASKTKVTGSALGVTTDKTIDNYDEDYKYGRFDVLLGAGAGVDLFGSVRVSVGYDFGLVNRYTGDADLTRHRNQLVVGVAYLF